MCLFSPSSSRSLFLRVVDAVLVGEERPEDGAHLQEVVPILVVAGEAAHLDAEDQADMVHGHLGQQPLESAPPVGRPAAQPLILVDDQDAIPGPAQGGRVVGEGILPLPRFAMVEHLLGVGLADVDDGEAVEVEVEDLGRSQDAGLADRPVVSGPGGGRGRSAWSDQVRSWSASFPGGRPRQLLRDDATERQERPIAVGLREGLPELGQRDAPGSASAARGGLDGTGVSHDDPPC